MKTNLAKSISSGYLLFFVSNVVALFLTPFILSYITSGEYGLYVIALDIIAWISLVQFGSGSVLGPKIASYYSNYELNLTKINRIVSTAFYMQIFYAIAGFVLFIIFGYYIINDEKVNFTDINSFIFIVAFSAFFTILNQVFSSMIIATKKIYIDNLISIFFLAIRVILIAALIRGMGLMAIAWALFISNLLILIRSYFRIKTLFPNIKISTKLFNKVDLNFLFGNGLYFAIGGLAMLLITNLTTHLLEKK